MVSKPTSVLPTRYELAGLPAPFHSNHCLCGTCQQLDDDGSWIKLTPRDILLRLRALEDERGR